MPMGDGLPVQEFRGRAECGSPVPGLDQGVV